jgi:TonB family protein
MKRTMLAILALSPVMLYGQAKTPAQPGPTPVLQSRNIQPAAFAAVHSADAAAPTPVRISSGVTPPQLVYSVDVDRNHVLDSTAGELRNVTVDMTVDESGKPSNIKVVKSADLFTDGGIVSAVDRYRYKPATLNGNAVPMAVRINFTIQQ